MRQVREMARAQKATFPTMDSMRDKLNRIRELAEALDAYRPDDLETVREEVSWGQEVLETAYRKLSSPY